MLFRNKQSHILAIDPSKHTTSFRHPYNIHNVKTTSYGRQNNVMCVLGCLNIKTSLSCSNAIKVIIAFDINNNLSVYYL